MRQRKMVAAVELAAEDVQGEIAELRGKGRVPTRSTRWSRRARCSISWAMEIILQAEALPELQAAPAGAAPCRRR
jgi:hypothetical protein